MIMHILLQEQQTEQHICHKYGQQIWQQSRQQFGQHVRQHNLRKEQNNDTTLLSLFLMVTSNWMLGHRNKNVAVTEMATAGPPCEQFCVLQRSDQDIILMLTCAEQPEELANALGLHHAFTVRVLLTATTINLQDLPRIQERLINENNNWFRTSLAQVLKAVSEVAESNERPHVFANETDTIKDLGDAASDASHSVLSEDNPYGEMPTILDVLEECNVGVADKGTKVRAFLCQQYGKALAKTLLAQLQEGVRASHAGEKRRVYLHDGRGLRIKEQSA